MPVLPPRFCRMSSKPRGMVGGMHSPASLLSTWLLVPARSPSPRPPSQGCLQNCTGSVYRTPRV